ILYSKNILLFLPITLMGKDIISSKQGCPHRPFIGCVFACNVVGGAVVRGGTDDGKAGGKVYAIVKCQGFKRDQALVVVHGEDSVKFLLMHHPEKAVRRIGSKNHGSFVLEFFDHWTDDGFFFFSQKAIFTRMWI